MVEIDATYREAEWVLGGHPDRLADAVADLLVDAACERDPDALVGVEVAVHRDRVFVDGRIAGDGAEEIDVPAVVRAVYAGAGYGETWAPAPEALRVETDLCVGPLRDGEREIRGVSDDQSIVVGFATGDERTNFLPAEHFLARTLAQRLDEVRRRRADLLGPDGKVLVALSGPKSEPQIRAVSVSIQHAEGADDVEVLSLVREAAQKWHGEPLEEGVLRVNGAGNFAVGGPLGDNGLSGKKLAVDFYGPSVPLGGGALCGKDPHKVDRLGSLRARQIAKNLVQAGILPEALVRLSFEPGGTGPARVAILRDNGAPLEDRFVRRWLSGYDLSLSGSHADLGLAKTRFGPRVVWGPWSDASNPWEWWRVS